VFDVAILDMLAPCSGIASEVLGVGLLGILIPSRVWLIDRGVRCYSTGGWSLKLIEDCREEGQS
jgi:hypothetical protein